MFLFLSHESHLHGCIFGNGDPSESSTATHLVAEAQTESPLLMRCKTEMLMNSEWQHGGLLNELPPLSPIMQAPKHTRTRRRTRTQLICLILRLLYVSHQRLAVGLEKKKSFTNPYHLNKTLICWHIRQTRGLNTHTAVRLRPPNEF